jgi:membrane protein YdbS with pleckstrin-like domain
LTPTASPDDGLDWKPIAPEAKTFWTIGATLVILVGFGIVGAIFLAAGRSGLAAGTLVLAVVTWMWIRAVVARRWRSWGYAERESDLLIRRGVLIRRFTVVPYGRMQFVDVTQGPLDRWLGLSNVTLHTAAARSDATIPLLATEEANRLRDRLVVLGDVRAAGL